MITAFIIIIIAIILIDFSLNYWCLKKCPKCKASLFDVIRIDKEVVSHDIENPNMRTERKTYKCRTCNHRWSIKSKYDENSEGS